MSRQMYSCTLRPARKSQMKFKVPIDLPPGAVLEALWINDEPVRFRRERKDANRRRKQPTK